MSLEAWTLIEDLATFPEERFAEPSGFLSHFAKATEPRGVADVANAIPSFDFLLDAVEDSALGGLTQFRFDVRMTIEEAIAHQTVLAAGLETGLDPQVGKA